MTFSDLPHERIIPVCAAAVIRECRVLVGRRKPDIGDPGRWELPGGKLAPGEDPRACVAREFFEEFGVRARVGDLFAVVNHRYDDRNILLIVYRASIPAGRLSSTDHDRLVWADAHELTRLDFLEADRPVVRRLIEELGQTQP
jgi:8-oxo-dGTP diphosphatase